MLEKAAENVSFSSQSSLVLRVVGRPSQIPHSTTPEQDSLSSNCSSSSEEDEAGDETMRANSPPVEFDDEEAWESHSQSSVSDDASHLTSSTEEPGHPLVASTPPMKGKTPLTICDTNTRDQDQSVNPSSRQIQDQVIEIEPNSNEAHVTSHSLSQQTVVPSYSSLPTSNLIKKLFPALGSEKYNAPIPSVSREKGTLCAFALCNYSTCL